MEPQSTHTIITHYQPHPDEYVAIYLLQKEGSKLFPGIDEAEVLILRPDDKLMAGRTPEQMEADGYLMIGVGGGRFDEHAVGDKPRTEGHSAASLVAEALGLTNDPRYKKLINYATDNDLSGKTELFEWAAMLKDMHATYAHAPLMVWNWAVMYMDAFVQQQEAFHVEAKRELKRAKRIHHHLGKTLLKIVSVQTDAQRVKARAFSPYDGYNAIVVQRNFRGHIQIFANSYYHLDLTQVVAAVRKAELERRGGSPDSQVNYAAEGTLETVPAWYYFREGDMLLNGSLTAPDVTPSWLSLEEVTDLVIKNIRKKRPAKARRELALSGADRA